jgi:hypothetical protein
MFNFSWSQNHHVEGVVVRFHSKNAIFWREKNEFGPDLTRWNYASEIYEEKKHPHALVVDADACGAYVKVMWGEKIGWVSASSLTSS